MKEEAKKKKREKTSNFKVPEKLAGEAGLAPVQSDRSSRFEQLLLSLLHHRVGGFPEKLVVVM